jgi:hypothetical protein
VLFRLAYLGVTNTLALLRHRTAGRLPGDQLCRCLRRHMFGLCSRVEMRSVAAHDIAARPANGSAPANQLGSTVKTLNP